jgi:hypothetical protein
MPKSQPSWLMGGRSDSDIFSAARSPAAFSATKQDGFFTLEYTKKCTRNENVIKNIIGLLPPSKYMDFIFFPECSLKKLLESKFSEF